MGSYFPLYVHTLKCVPVCIVSIFSRDYAKKKEGNGFTYRTSIVIKTAKICIDTTHFYSAFNGGGCGIYICKQKNGQNVLLWA